MLRPDWTARRPWVWFDIENTPQVLFLEPFIRVLRDEGYQVGVTVKPQAQAIELARARGIEVVVVGDGNFVRYSHKVAGGARRSVELVGWARRQPGRAAVQIQSSRSASLAARALGVPAIGMLDYEGAIHWPLAVGCRSIWFPDLLTGRRLGPLTRRVARFYPGLKENLYLDNARLDRNEARRAAGIDPRDFFVVARPPAESAHYASDESWHWWTVAIGRLLQEHARMLIVPRDRAQGERIGRLRGIGDAGVRIATDVLDGPSLVLAADLVVGGGGTMNREAAVLGTPAWSTFAGPKPGIDDGLAREGRLHWVHGEADLRAALAALGSRHTPRGPFPEGFRMILEDARRFLPTTEHSHMSLR